MPKTEPRTKAFAALVADAKRTIQKSFVVCMGGVTRKDLTEGTIDLYMEYAYHMGGHDAMKEIFAKGKGAKS